MLGVPVVVLSLPLAWLVMTRFAFALPRTPLRASRQAIALQLQALGPMTRGEKLVGTVFIITALLWIFEPLLSSAFPKAKLSDAGIAIFGAVLLFLLPVDFKAGQFALELKQAKKLPYEVLILFGGGISLAQAIQKSGLATFVSQSLSHLNDFSLLLMIFLVALAAIFATELIGNTALAATMLPIVAPIALAMGENPIFLLLPATLGVSCAFMLPVGTPPNAIVYASGYINMPQMARAGLWLNALFTVLLTFLVFFLAPLVFEAQFGTLPEWAKIQK
jgi:sodium-dependent dicarboxylate transporter 2/3/5